MKEQNYWVSYKAHFSTTLVAKVSMTAVVMCCVCRAHADYGCCPLFCSQVLFSIFNYSKFCHIRIKILNFTSKKYTIHSS